MAGGVVESSECMGLRLCQCARLALLRSVFSFGAPRYRLAPPTGFDSPGHGVAKLPQLGPIHRRRLVVLSIVRVHLGIVDTLLACCTVARILRGGRPMDSCAVCLSGRRAAGRRRQEEAGGGRRRQEAGGLTAHERLHLNVVLGEALDARS